MQGSVHATTVHKHRRRLICASFSSLCGTMTMLLVLLIAFGAAIQGFEADNEIRKNEEFQDLINRLRTQNVNESDILSIAQFSERDVDRGLEGFTSFDEDAQEWRGKNAKAFFASCSYAFDLASTIGYGNIPAETRGGRAISIVAILVLFPIAVVAYTRLAEYIYNQLGNRLVSKNKVYKTVINRYDNEGIGELDVKELYLVLQDLGLQVTNEQCEMILKQYDFSDNLHLDESEFRQLCVDLQIKVGLLARENFELEVSSFLFFTYIIFFTIITYVSFLDNLFDSFYFVIITMTTVGLGDVVPPQELRPVFSLLAFIGIGFMALLFKAVIDKLYATTDLKKRYFHRALEPVFQRGKIVSIRMKKKLVPEEEDRPASVEIEDEK